ncbi:MAG: hypothetical protein C4339_04140 [Nitrososphaerota archaeon]
MPAELTPEALGRVDKAGLYEALLSWPEMLERAQVSLQGDLGSCEEIRFVGFGGSRVACELLARHLRSGRVGVYSDEVALRGLDKGCLLAVVSASGETKEALYLLRAAARRQARVAAICSGGRLMKLCRQQGAPCLLIPFRHSPRASFPYLLRGCFTLLGLCTGDRLEGLVPRIAARWREARQRNALRKGVRGPSARLAQHIFGGVAVCHYYEELGPVAQRFAKSLAENAKEPSLLFPIPEAMHNYICGLERLPGPRPVLLERGRTPLRQGVRAALEAFYREKGLRLHRLQVGQGLVGEAGALYELELATVYLAVLKGVDPTPVPNIERYKALLEL